MSPHRRSEWLPADWEHPTRVQLDTGPHLRPIRADGVEIMVAAMGSQQRLWSIGEGGSGLARLSDAALRAAVRATAHRPLGSAA